MLVLLSLISMKTLDEGAKRRKEKRNPTVIQIDNLKPSLGQSMSMLEFQLHVFLKLLVGHQILRILIKVLSRAFFAWHLGDEVRDVEFEECSQTALGRRDVQGDISVVEIYDQRLESYFYDMMLRRRREEVPP